MLGKFIPKTQTYKGGGGGCDSQVVNKCGPACPEGGSTLTKYTYDCDGNLESHKFVGCNC